MAITQYVGARYVPKFFSGVGGSTDWVTGIPYEPMTIVTYLGNSYTSRKPVPASVGSPNANTEYWALTGAYNEQIQEYSSIVTEVQTEFAGLREDVEGYTDRITTLEENVSAIGSTVEAVESNVSEMGDDITALQGNVSSALSRVTTVETSVGSLGTRVTSLETNVGTISGNVAGLSDDVDALDTRVGTAEASVETLGASVTTNTNNISTLNTTVSGLQSGKADLVNGKVPSSQLPDAPTFQGVPVYKKSTSEGAPTDTTGVWIVTE